jgi:acyl-CoA synthetase (AMP-forming)/AMP-acid ligase II
MRILSRCRTRGFRDLAIASLAASLLAGCVALPSSPSSEAATTQAREATSRNLLYVIVGTGAVNIVTAEAP